MDNSPEGRPRGGIGHARKAAEVGVPDFSAADFDAADFATEPPELGSQFLTENEPTDSTPAQRSISWGGGLSDREACERLRSMMLNVAKGQRHVSDDRQYERLRAIFMRKPHLKSRSPRLLLTYQTLDALDSHLKEMQRENRVPEVSDDFLRLMEWLGSTGDPGHDSSTWTGQKDASQHARTVRAYSVNALRVVEQLLAESEARFGNGGPLEPAEEDALNSLREFRDALTALIECLEAKQPLDQKLEKVRSIGERAYAAVIGHLKGDVAAFLPMASTLSYSAIVAMLATTMTAATYAPEVAFSATAAAYLKFGPKKVKKGAEPAPL